MKILKKDVRGVTLIALIVTLVLLLILTGVTISMMEKEGVLSQSTKIGNSKERKQIIESAKMDILNINLESKKQLSKDKFKEVLDKYFIYDLEGEDLPDDLSSLVLTSKNGNSNDILASEIYDGFFSDGASVKQVKNAKKLLEENTEIISDDNIRVTIPAGFTIPQESPSNAKEGIIMTDSIDKSTGESNGNEFVWIPINSDLTVAGTKKVMSKESTAEGYIGQNGITNYEGVFYNFDGIQSTEIEGYGQGTQLYREPDGGCWHDSNESLSVNHIRQILTDQADRYIDENAFKNTMQEDYNEMINSVKKYGGFYVGRYEMGIGNGKAISKAGLQTTSGNWNQSSQQWYGLYAYGKTFTNAKNSVKSSMIWGSQYDAMLNFVLTGNEKNKVTSTNNGYRGENAIETGKTKDDKIINIFDLGGNCGEWTLENWSGYRIVRGGFYDSSDYSPSHRHHDYGADSTRTHDSTRLTLYIK